MAIELAHQRCFNHGDREAVARGPECRQYFCRECVTEHEDRVLCAGCLARLTGQGDKRVRRLGALWRAAQFAAAVLVVWLVFYGLGQGLLALPSSFHEGVLWQADPFEP